MKWLMLMLRGCWLAVLVLLVGACIAAYALLSAPQATPWVASQVVLFSQGLIPVARVSGSLSGPLVVEELVVDTPDVRVEVRDAQLEWRALSLLARSLRVESLQADSVRLIIKDKPPQPPSDALTRLPLTLRVQAADIRRFDLVLEPVADPVSFHDIRLSADWLGDEIRLHEAALRFDPVGTAQLAGLLRLHPRAITLEGVQVRGWGDMTVDSRIDYDGLHFQADARWQGLRWPQQGEAWFRSAQGRVEVDGQWTDYQFKFQGPVESQAAGFPLRGVIAASGRGSLSALEIEQSQIQTLGGEADLQGRVQWLPQLALQAAGGFSQLNPVSLHAQWPGRLNGQLEAIWKPEAALPMMDLALSLHDSQLRGYPLRLDAQMTMRQDQWSIPKLHAQSGGSQLRASGDIFPRLRVAATLKSTALGELWPDLSGAGTTSLRAEGTLENPRIEAQAQLAQVAYPGITIRKLDLDASLHTRDASRLQLRLEGTQAGIAIPQFLFTANGTAADHQLKMTAQTELGEMALGFQGALDVARRYWEGELREGSGQPVRLSAWTLQEPAALAFSLASANLSPACWKSQNGRACFQFHAREGETRGAFRLERLAFAYFEPLLPPGWNATGEVTGTGLMVDDRGRWTVEADLKTSAGQLRVGQAATLNFQPSELHAEETTDGFLGRLLVPMEQGNLSGQVRLAAAPDGESRQWSGRVELNLQRLDALRLLTPEIESAGGRLQAHFDLSGAGALPQLDGEARLSDGRLRLYTPGIEMSDLQAVLRNGTGPGHYALSASAQSGGGTLRLNGDGGPDENLPWRVELSGENFQIMNTPDAKVWVSPRLQFHWLKDQAELTGEVLVPRARITPAEFAQGVSPSRDQVIVRESDIATNGSRLNLISAVRIRLGDDVRFDGLGLKTQLTGALNAMDDPGRPTRADGQIELKGGTYKAYGQDLTIETGRLLYNGGPITEPALELRATRKPTDTITVGLSVRGTLDAPQFNLFSTPALPQEQQLSWLILGRSLESDGSAAQQGLLTGAALTLGLTGGDYLAQRVRGGLRLDEISIGAKPGESSDNAKLTLGKYLSPKLYVSYGIGLFQPGHSFRLQYDMGRGFKLSTETGVESGGDLLYTVEH